MHNKIKAILITLLVIMWVAGIVNTAMVYPTQTQSIFVVVLAGAGIYWLYKLILSIIENK